MFFDEFSISSQTSHFMASYAELTHFARQPIYRNRGTVSCDSRHPVLAEQIISGSS